MEPLNRLTATFELLERLPFTLGHDREMGSQQDPVDLTNADASQREYIEISSDDGTGSESSEATFADEFESSDIFNGEYRNAPVEFPLITHDKYLPGSCEDGPNFVIHSGDTVELGGGDSRETDISRGNNFFKVLEIIEDLTTETFYLRGWRFISVTETNGMLDARLNEVVRKLEVDRDDTRPPLLQGKETIPIQEALYPRRLIITNELFPKHSYAEHNILDPSAGDHDEASRRIHHSSVLVCRSNLITKSTSAIPRRDQARRPLECEIRRISEDEADKHFKTSDRNLLTGWIERVPKQKGFYTFADCFCGAGGASSGAFQADLTLTWAFDQDQNATQTYRLNFPNATVYTASADHMIAIFQVDDHYVDILHISPPCQFCSPANPHCNPHLDEINQATFLAVQELIKTIKPRIILLEETSGLLTHHPVWLYKLINMFTCNNYSVRWKVDKLDEQSVVQKRKRVIAVASAPGGILPKFPKPTHGPGTGQQYMTVAQALAPLIGRPIVHRAHDRNRRAFQPRTPYSADQPLRRAITCGGANDCHPSGERHFTVEETAALQGFPVEFQFPSNQTNTTLKKQIGNAFPPCAAKNFYKEIALTLEHEDMERFSGE